MLNNHEVLEVVAVLTAAPFRGKLSDENATWYIEEFRKCEDSEHATRTLDFLVETSDYWPTVAQIRAARRAARGRSVPPSLAPPPGQTDAEYWRWLYEPRRLSLVDGDAAASGGSGTDTDSRDTPDDS